MMKIRSGLLHAMDNSCVTIIVRIKCFSLHSAHVKGIEISSGNFGMSHKTDLYGNEDDHKRDLRFHAGNADNSGDAGNFGNADNSDNTNNFGNADHSDNAENSGKADNSGNTDNSGNAGNFGNADSSGNADNSDNADSEKFILQQLTLCLQNISVWMTNHTCKSKMTNSKTEIILYGTKQELVKGIIASMIVDIFTLGTLIFEF